MARTNGHCAYCGVPRASTVDHIFPIKLGGTDGPANLVAACYKCNKNKSHLTTDEFRRYIVGENKLFFCEDGLPKTFKRVYLKRSLHTLYYHLCERLAGKPSRTEDVLRRLLKGERKVDLQDYKGDRKKLKERFRILAKASDELSLNGWIVQYNPIAPTVGKSLPDE